MGQSDALSRWPNHCPDEDHDNKDMIMLEEELFLNLLDLDLQEQIASGKELDFDAAEALEALLGNGPTTLQHDLEDWKLETVDDRRILFYKGKNYIPKDSSLQWDLVKSYHDLEMAGHPGELETYNLVKEHYWWPSLRSFVKSYVQGCGDKDWVVLITDFSFLTKFTKIGYSMNK